MFAAATREVVFSRSDVVRRIQEEFIPVALKAGMVNNPPSGIEGLLYAEIRRSRPAPQGICTMNSAGKVLTWALSFDDDESILRYLDHVRERYRESPAAVSPVVAERYRKFPGRELPTVDDLATRLLTPEKHSDGTRCPAEPVLAKQTLVGRIIGRPLDSQGKPLSDTTRQENYMEARFEVPLAHQQQLARTAADSKGKRFRLPVGFVQSVVSPAFLGQLDVNPLGTIPGSRSKRQEWNFYGQLVPGTDGSRVRIDGASLLEGGQGGTNSRSDGRMWQHRVQLNWQGYVDIQESRLSGIVLVANGDEQLSWENKQFNLSGEADVEHLMAGHPINMDCAVRYGLTARPVKTPSAAKKRIDDEPRSK